MAFIAFRQILTMVLLMAFGFFCCKAKFIDDHTNKKLSSLVLYVINPIVVFMSYIRPYEPELLSGLMTALLLSVLAYAIAITGTHIFFRKKGANDFAVEKLAAVYANCGFFGIPLIRGIFGDEGIFYLTAYLTTFTLLIWTHGASVMSGKTDGSLIKKALTSPAVISVVLGFSFFMLQIPITDYIMRPLEMLANTNTPLAMIVAGVSIACTKPSGIFTNSAVYKVCFMRLLFLPAIFIALLGFFDLPAVASGTIILASACPTAANVVMFAIRHDKDHIFASELFAATTVCSMGTIPLLLLFV